MRKNHIESILIVGEPLREPEGYNFKGQNITERIYKTIPSILENRMKSPPDEVYSLHRKLSGAYLECIRLGAKVNVWQIFKEIQFRNLCEELGEDNS